MLIQNAEIEGESSLDVRIDGDRVTAIGCLLERRAGEPVLDAGGGALLPGLHDHHIHLFALAAALGSLRCGPPFVRTTEALGLALRTECESRPAGSRDWIRGVGYCESVAGALDRFALDRWVADRPLRVQHRSGSLWMLNSAAVDRLRLDASAPQPPGLERDERGRITGRLFRLDGWLRERLGDREREIPSLEVVGRQLARFGVTGVTDATPANGDEELRAFSAAVVSGALPQRLQLMGRPELPPPTTQGVVRGAVKIMLDEAALPEFDALRSAIARAHDAGRAVAVHCVTRAELVFTLTAIASAGPFPGDRIEHAAVAPPELVAQMAEMGLWVVTQPNFIYERGDDYAIDVDPSDRIWLYRGAGFLTHGVPLGGGTDAPFGNPDPWIAMRAAVTRRSLGGLVLGRDEGIPPEAALALFTTPLDRPGGPPRRVARGVPADLCLLDRPWSAARSQLASSHVRATLRAGRIVWDRA